MVACVLALMILLGYVVRCPAIQLGDKQVPKERFIVFIFMGHSNMAGRAKPSDKQSHPRAWKYEFPIGRKWVPGKEPLSYGNKSKWGGPGMPFLKKLVKEFPDYHFGIIQNALPSRYVAGHYSKGKAPYEEIIAEAKEINNEATLGGIVAMLGYVEMTRGEPERAEKFLRDLKTTVQNIRSDLDQPNLPFFMGKLEDDAPNLVNAAKYQYKGKWYRGRHKGRWGRYVDVMRDQFKRIPREISNSAVGNCAGNYDGSHHFDVEGQRLWAHDAVKIFKTKNWIPPLTLAVRITAPADGIVVDRGKQMTIRADVHVAENEVKPSKVIFFLNGRRVHSDDAPPYTYDWRARKRGVNIFKAEISNKKHGKVSSKPIFIGVGSVPKILMVAGASGLSSGERAIRDRLQSQEFLVHVRDDDAIAVSDVSDYKLLVLAASCSRLGVRKFADIQVPIVSSNPYYDELNLTEKNACGVIEQGNGIQVVQQKSIPLGISGKCAVADRKVPMNWAACSPTMNTIATLDDDQEKAVVFAYDAGAQLPRLNAIAPARRVGFFAADGSALHFTKTGWQLWDAAIKWTTTGRQKTFAPSKRKAAYDTWPGNTKGLTFLWDARNRGNRVLAPDGKAMRKCAVTPHLKANYGRFNDMILSGGYFECKQYPELLERMKGKASDRGELSIEFLITPGSETQDGPGRIITFGGKPRNENFIISQYRNSIVFRVRGRRGDFLLSRVEANKPQHIIVNCSQNEQLEAYVNGEKFNSSKNMQAGFGGWKEARLIFGADPELGPSWKGRLEGVAFYSRAIDAIEVRQKYALIAKRLRGRKPIPRLVVEGKLLETSVALGPASLYKRAMVVYKYAVDKVVKGDYRNKTILVRHWAVLDAKPIPEIVNRKKGQVYRLTLEPFEQHKQFPDEQFNFDFGDDDDLEMPQYYDMGPQHNVDVAQSKATPKS